MEGEELIASRRMRDKLLRSKTRTLRSISAAISHFKRRDSRVDGPIVTVSTIRPALLSPVHDELPHLQATQREEKDTPPTILPHAESNLLRSADAEGVNRIARESEAIETLQRVGEPIATASTIQLTLPRSVHDEPHCSQTTQREEKDTHATVLLRAESNQRKSADTKDAEQTTRKFEESEKLRQNPHESHSQVAELRKGYEAQSRDLGGSKSSPQHHRQITGLGYHPGSPKIECRGGAEHLVYG